jgi:hypothetical protein
LENSGKSYFWGKAKVDTKYALLRRKSAGRHKGAKNSTGKTMCKSRKNNICKPYYGINQFD